MLRPQAEHLGIETLKQWFACFEHFFELVCLSESNWTSKRQLGQVLEP